ncbi:citrate lyase holo-[acyl-carrier protein] synthase, partial [Acidaminococcus fermentans]|uniref:citrate lyase holo-[acyl-carrier protein] synthase n=2 Tax=Acidaminococcus TaxID=904 RepID=UPI00325ADAFE
MKETVIRLAGPQVEVPDMLLARDGRAAAQKKLLERYHRPLLFFTQNIPGPVKTSA